MIVLVGHSGAGKDTILKIMSKWYKPIVSYTTRPPRHYEIDGVDYNFICEKEFIALETISFFIAQQVYRAWYYGISRADIGKHRIAIVEPKGLQQLINNVGKNNLVIIYINADEEVRRERLKSRGDDREEIYRRIMTDRILFEHMDKISDFTFYNSGSNLEQLTEQVEFLIEDILIPYSEGRLY